MIEILIDAARHDPPAEKHSIEGIRNFQKTETKKKLARAAFNQAFIEEEPVLIVICADETRHSSCYGIRGETLYAGHMLIGAFNEDEVKKALKTPANIRSLAMIPVGFSQRNPSQRGRKPLKQIVN